MRTRIIIAVISLAIGLFAGAKIMEHLGREYIVNNFPIPSGTLDDKDVYVKEIVIDEKVPVKKLKQVKKKAKNVILFIGDGMSVSQISAFRLHQGGPNSRVAVDSFPYSGKVLTHSANAIVTDSASSGTAYSTGEKTNNRALGVDINGQPIENITETLDRSGYVSSVISTSEVTHATPAAFVAHTSSRYLTDEISIQMTDSKIKNIFTKVLKGHIAVATTDINKDDTGKKIDKRARKFLNKSNLDYAHGTGHGVGFFLNVHEGPQSITKINTVKIREGMILSNEPGYYKTNEYGIRIENLVYVKKIKKNVNIRKTKKKNKSAI